MVSQSWYILCYGFPKNNSERISHQMNYTCTDYPSFYEFLKHYKLQTSLHTNRTCMITHLCVLVHDLSENDSKISLMCGFFCRSITREWCLKQITFVWFSPLYVLFCTFLKNYSVRMSVLFYDISESYSEKMTLHTSHTCMFSFRENADLQK